MTDRLAGIRAKIERAKQNICDFDSSERAFFDSGYYRIVVEPDSQAHEFIYSVHVVKELPISLSLIAGDAVHQLRSSLDHLVWQLVEANGSAPTDKTAFPISEDMAKYESQKTTKIKGVSARAESLIDCLKPYKAGNDALWQLNKLDNIDKHRLLLPIAFACRRTKLDRHSSLTVHLLGPVANAPSARIPIMKDRTEIGRVPGSGPLKKKDHFNFSLGVSFWEPQVVEGEPVVPFLHQLCNLVDGIATSFIPML